ncbi:MAG TPA: class I SAM-dependent methyltransferase [Gaiellaceae bacterium]|jgi:malonyl-CoA O-methyltransferase
MTPGQRFARLAATVSARIPAAMRLFRGPLRSQFDRLAPEWNDRRVSERYLAPLTAALAAVDTSPARIVDVGTGTGAAARLAAARWPDADVHGFDLSPGMVAEARARAGARQRYDVADATRLPLPDASADLVVMVNMIPFFDELARIVAPGGSIAIAYSSGPSTPIWVPLDRVGRELERRGLGDVRTFAAGAGLSLLAVRPHLS